jgi:hypothetical protein
MKHLHYIISLFLLFVLVACSGAGDKSDASSIDPSENNVIMMVSLVKANGVIRIKEGRPLTPINHHP